MIVVDSNILVYWLLPSEHTALMERVWAKDSNWIVPTLWHSEFRNVLAVFMRQDRLSLAEAYETMAEAELLFAHKTYDVSSRAVLALIHESTCSAYDCEFVALAQNLGLTLVTADKRMIQDFPHTAVHPQQFIQQK